MFANYNASFSRNLAASDPDLASNDGGGGGGTYDPARLDRLMDNLQRFEDNFSRHLKILLDALNYLAATETVVFLSLCARLSMANEGMANGSSVNNAFG